MSEQRWNQLLKHLEEQIFITSERLATDLGVSSRTIRNDLKELSIILMKHGAEIESKPKIGNRLLIHHQAAYQQFTKQFEEYDEVEIPSSSQERVQYLLEYLLVADDYVKIDDLSESLFIGKSTISQDLKEVRERLQEYNLTLTNRPNYGIKVEGREFDLRLCIANHTINRVKLDSSKNEGDQKAWLEKIANILSEVFDNAHFQMNDVSFQNLIVHI